jgi:hypothetical protein
MWQYNYKNENNEDDIAWGYVKTNYITPKLVQNLGGNNDFKSTSGWDCHVIVSNSANGKGWADQNL